MRKVQAHNPAGQLGCEELQGDLMERLIMKKRQTMVGRGTDEKGRGVVGGRELGKRNLEKYYNLCSFK